MSALHMTWKKRVPALFILYETLGCTRTSLCPKKPGPQTKSSPFYTIVVGKNNRHSGVLAGVMEPSGVINVVKPALIA